LLLQKKTFFLSLFIFYACILHAQEEKFAIRHFTKEDGLSHNATIAIFQDSRQFIWVGTRYGLTRFDGEKFKTFSKRNNGLDQTDIIYIFEDQYGKLWIVFYDNWISIFDVEKERAVSFDEYFPNAPFQNKDIHLIKSGHENKISIIKEDGGFFQFGLDFQQVTTHEKLSDLSSFSVSKENEIIGFNLKHQEVIKVNSKGEEVESVSLKTPSVFDIGYFSDKVFWVSLDGGQQQLEDRLLAFDSSTVAYRKKYIIGNQ